MSDKNMEINDRKVTFKMDSGNKYKITEEGYLQCDAYIAEPGILIYNTPEGKTVREYFPESECFDEKSMITAKLKPITVEHAFDGVQYNMINANNIDVYQVGYSGENIRKQDGRLTANVLITQKHTVDDILRRKADDKNIELSMGYTCQVVPTSGVSPDNKQYDAIQTQRRYNHISIVEQGRAGKNVKLKFDKGDTMSKKAYTRDSIKLDSFTSDKMNFMINEEHVDAFDAILSKFDEAVGVISKQDKKINDLNKAHDELLAKFDAQKSIIEDKTSKLDILSNPNSDQFQTILKQRKELEEVGSLFKIDCAGKDNKTIKINIIKTACKTFDSSKEYSDDYINARYETVVEMIDIGAMQEHNDSMSRFNLAIKSSGGVVDPRAEFIQKTKDLNKEE